MAFRHSVIQAKQFYELFKRMFSVRFAFPDWQFRWIRRSSLFIDKFGCRNQNSISRLYDIAFWNAGKWTFGLFFGGRFIIALFFVQSDRYKEDNENHL